MAHAIGLRATSMAASAAILSLAVLAALSFSYTIQQLSPPDTGHPIDIIRPEPPAAPPIPRDNHPPPPTAAEPTETVLPTLDQPPPLNLDSIVATVGDAYVGPVAIANPHWVQRPRDLDRYYPRRALSMNVQGQVMLDCLVNVEGALACQVVSETPAGWGFGAAAVRISEDYAMVPATRDGQRVEGRYRMRVPFDLR
jgi:protein TonB